MFATVLMAPACARGQQCPPRCVSWEGQGRAGGCPSQGSWWDCALKVRPLDRWGDAATRRTPAGARASAPLQLQPGTLKSRVDWYKGPPGLLPGLPHSPHGVQPPQDLPRALQCKREAASTASAAADTKRKAWAELNPTPSLESKSTAL